MTIWFQLQRRDQERANDTTDNPLLVTSADREGGIRKVPAPEAKTYFVSKLSDVSGASYNKKGLQFILDLAASEEGAPQSGNERPVCAICIDDLEMSSRPVFMPCLHCVCRECVIAMLEGTGQPAGSRAELITCTYPSVDYFNAY